MTQYRTGYILSSPTCAIIHRGYFALSQQRVAVYRRRERGGKVCYNLTNLNAVPMVGLYLYNIIV